MVIGLPDPSGAGIRDFFKHFDPRAARRRQLESSSNYDGRGYSGRTNAGPGRGGHQGSARRDPFGGPAAPESEPFDRSGFDNLLNHVGDISEFAGALSQLPKDGGQQQKGTDWASILAGGQGPDQSGAIAGSYDSEIAALRGAGGRMAGLTDQLIGNIQGSAGSANKQIGSFFGYAGDQAQAGRPVIGEAYDTARTNVDQTYDQLAAQLAGLPQATADQARAAGGKAAGSSIADRVAVAAAPFAAAGEGGRAATQANLQQHSTAGQDYLTQLASAAPSEAAQAQSAVSGRANQAVTSAQMALAEQQANIELQVARTEGAKQRALAEYAADSAGDTFGRAKDLLDLEFRQNQIRLQEQELAGEGEEEEYDPTQGSGYEAFDRALQGANPETQEFGQDLLPFLDRGLMSPEGDELNYEHLFQRLRPNTDTRGPARVGSRAEVNRSDTANTLNELVEQILAGGVGEGEDRQAAQMKLPPGVSLEDLRRALRQQTG